MSKWIKARQCEVCGELFPVYNGGLIFAKKYSRMFIGEYRNLAFCGGCAYAMMDYAKRKKVESENAGSD